MFSSLLIANRGEIACRIIRTARRLGLRTVAVYSDADRDALHVAMADTAYRIGPAEARKSYLDIGAILDAAARSGAEAVHPGYGFLAENADFAEACAAAGLVFVGPPATAIRAMGSKAEAKALMEGAGVPLVPGYHGAEQDPARLKAEADRIGYPVLIKASAGGGGKGMRLVEEPEAFSDALAAAQREAKAGFGDDRVLVEKFVTRPRHIEMQVFADTAGNAVHMFERDCSLQRRHQKVVEEAPAPGLPAAMRSEMAEAALAAARAIGYVGAGTVEFIASTDQSYVPQTFYFMEMNTRLQVEHPVTEQITGVDLVEWQLRTAAGEPLPLSQDQIRCTGHAFEVRLYAEEPTRGFLPATGRLDHLVLPQEDTHVRVETGVRQGDPVSVHYDPMIAKIVVSDEGRDAALRRLRAALGVTEISGLATNLEFLGAVAADPDFAAGAVDTGFIGRHRARLVPRPGPASDTVMAFAALHNLLSRAAAAETTAAASADPYSPWHRTDGWRLNDTSHTVLRFFDGDRDISITAHYRAEGFLLDQPGGRVAAAGTSAGNGRIEAEIGGARLAAAVLEDGHDRIVLLDGRTHRLTLFDPIAAASADEAGGAHLSAPMPGRIAAVHVADGELVEAGQALMVLEAMKMEHTIRAPAAGEIERIRYGVGEQVEEGAELIVFADA